MLRQIEVAHEPLHAREEGFDGLLLEVVDLDLARPAERDAGALNGENLLEAEGNLDSLKIFLLRVVDDELAVLRDYQELLILQLDKVLPLSRDVDGQFCLFRFQVEVKKLVFSIQAHDQLFTHLDHPLE